LLYDGYNQGRALCSYSCDEGIFGSYIQWKRETYIDDIEDEIDAIAATSSDAAGKLRIKRLLGRKQRYVEQLSAVRSDGDSPA